MGDFKEKIKTNLSERYTEIMRDFKEIPENPEERDKKLQEIKVKASSKDVSLYICFCFQPGATYLHTENKAFKNFNN